jgi:phosphatidylinositol alpha-1,6-mannosyltransferase
VTRSALVVAPSLQLLGGGIEEHTRHVVGALARLGGGARLAVVTTHEGMPVNGSPARVFAAQSGWSRAPTAAAATARATLWARPRVVLCEHAHLLPLAWMAARMSAAKLVAVAHGVEVWESGRPRARAWLRRADRVVAVSADTARRLPPGCDVRVVPNAVDTARFSPGPVVPAVERALADCPKPRLLSVSRLDASEGYKGVDDVLTALARRPSAGSYIVVGDGSDRRRLEAMAARLGVRARFLGRVPAEDLASYYRAADAFALPSRGEGFGYVFIEAAAVGLPVIGADAGGAADAVSGLGALVPPGDIDALAAAISTALVAEAPSARQHRRAEVERRFGLDGYAARLDAAIS